MSAPVDGLLLVDKPSGPTSHDIVDVLRRLLGQRRVGHTGTLDPPASGLLPIVLGRATRLARFLPRQPKLYTGTLRLGISTSTDDMEGEVLARHAGPLPGPEEVAACAARFHGRLRQAPPAVSARKVRGRRLYQLAREGRSVEVEPAPVEIFGFDLEPDGDDGADWRFTVEVSSGFYVRALARDLGRSLGCGGTLVRLRRLGIGPMHASRAVRLAPGPGGDPGGLREAVVPIEAMPLEPPPLRLDSEIAARRFASGVSSEVPAGAPPGGACRVLHPQGRLLGVGEIRDGRLHPRVVLQTCCR